MLVGVLGEQTKKKKGNLMYKGIGRCIKGEREAEIAPKRRAGTREIIAHLGIDARKE